MGVSSFLSLGCLIIFEIIKYVVVLFCIYKVVRYAIRKELENSKYDDRENPNCMDKNK